jgi:hypothetical protein
LLFTGLYKLGLSEATVSRIALPFAPGNINITPDDRHLLLRDELTDAVHRFDLAGGRLGCRFERPSLQ